METIKNANEEADEEIRGRAVSRRGPHPGLSVSLELGSVTGLGAPGAPYYGTGWRLPQWAQSIMNSYCLREELHCLGVDGHDDTADRMRSVSQTPN